MVQNENSQLLPKIGKIFSVPEHKPKAAFDPHANKNTSP